MKEFKQIFTTIFLIIVIIIAIKPSNNNSKKDFQTELESFKNSVDGDKDAIDNFIFTQAALNASRKNYDTFDNFIFQFQNTISGWFGKSVDDYNRRYLSEKFVEKNLILILGKYLPYLCVLITIIMFLIRFPKKIKSKNI